MISLQMKMISSLEKCFLDDSVESKPAKNSFIMFANEKLSFQVVYRTELIGQSLTVLYAHYRGPILLFTRLSAIPPFIPITASAIISRWNTHLCTSLKNSSIVLSP